MRTLIIDNYDSFTYNLYQYVGELGGAPEVYRNDVISLAEIQSMEPTHIIISPGPGHPDDPAYFGVCREVILTMGKRIPLLGVCLGHQGICSAFGGKVVRATKIMHGKTSMVGHTGGGVFANISSPIEVMRYHSLVAEKESLPDCLVVTATTLDDGLIMALEHRDCPIHGIQFHPESIGTPVGKEILRNFLSFRV